MSERCTNCKNPHDSWIGNNGLLCQDCWEIESDKAYWRQAISIDQILNKIANMTDANELTSKELDDLSTKLLPCPFCGGEVTIEIGGTDAELMCDGCYATNSIQISDYFTYEERHNNPEFKWRDYPHHDYGAAGTRRAIEVLTNFWNRRESDAQIEALSLQLEAASQELARTQQNLISLKEDNAFLKESLDALKNKLGDNCCACSYDKIEDVCMAHTPKLKEAIEALEFLCEAKNIKDRFGAGIAYDKLLERGWELGELFLIKTPQRKYRDEH